MGLYPVFANWAKKYGLTEALEAFNGDIPSATLQEFRERFQTDVAAVTAGGPLVIAAGYEEPWYSGPSEESLYWAKLRDWFADAGWDEERIAALDSSTDKVVAHTPRPAKPRIDAKGLVVGYVQSGKTTNFTSVIAKLADEDYQFVIVLSGIHNGLRKQTQKRLDEQLVRLNDARWLPLTREDADFLVPTFSASSALSHAGPALAIVKKNAAVLKRLIKWLDNPQSASTLKQNNVLIIDDEADQATVATATINPLIRKLLGLFPKSTYIGYTATPFANVFIDPSESEDLYPKDFILNLPRPEGYFGPERIFGRNVAEGDDDEPYPDGLDMVRIVPEESIPSLTPIGKHAAADFSPELTNELADAIRWFWLATAARRARGDLGHSTMLIHTSIKIDVHESYRAPLEHFQAMASRAVRRGGSELDEWRELWELESAKVDRVGHEQNSFDEVLEHLGAAIDATRVILDNYRSEDRLVYEDEPVVAIAVGGNTLSRGLTLEGLVVSFFIRTATAYDTLLQMGRWFGFRTGYEDLPRIWMTQFLESAFRHLATVEYEMRSDIEHYQHQNLTPLDVAVRIRTHPALRITAKMGAAQPAYVSFAGRRLQTRYFRTADVDWLEGNLNAANALVHEAASTGERVDKDSAIVFRGVNVKPVFDFLAAYKVHEDSPDLDFKLMRKYVEKEMSAEIPTLNEWDVAIMRADASPVRIGDVEVGSVIRSRLKDSRPDRADIKTLMSKVDRVIDMDIDSREARSQGEEDLVSLRNADPVFKRRGLIVLYPIDATSAPKQDKSGQHRLPLDALQTVIGVGFVFPGDPETKNQVLATHLAVDLAGIEPTDREDVTEILNVDTEDLEQELPQ